MKKRVITCVYVLLFIICAKLGFQYLYNEYVLNQYNQENYSLNTDPLLLGNWIQPYLAHYNMGNIHYQNEKYEDAVKEYKEALGLNPGKERECSVRINLALAMIKTMGEDYHSEENVETSIETLKEARSILLEHDCATEKGDGHSETAQKLKEEIDEMIEELEKNKEPESDDPNHSKDDLEEKKDDETEEEDIKEKLKQQQEEAYKERAESIQSYEEYEFNFDADGRVW
ncbi:MAG: tetratricopeptide repeat protein [Lachnospiraceae bacterium]|nr:tetratricopeptide repeat protein [Lachnospiraceae bacterium]